MDPKKLVADSIAASVESGQKTKLAGQLARQARHVIGDRALKIAMDAPSVPGEIVVKEWHDTTGKLRRIIVTPRKDVLSYTYSDGRPSGRAKSVHRLRSVPLKHLEEHFGPLMTSSS